jgi:hypothetical protein
VSVEDGGVREGLPSWARRGHPFIFGFAADMAATCERMPMSPRLCQLPATELISSLSSVRKMLVASVVG